MLGGRGEGGGHAFDQTWNIEKILNYLGVGGGGCLGTVMALTSPVGTYIVFKNIILFYYFYRMIALGDVWTKYAHQIVAKSVQDWQGTAHDVIKVVITRRVLENKELA